jgi:hypothetical protein
MTYRVRLDVPGELAVFVSRLLARHRKELGTRKGTRSLGCYRQALFGLAWSSGCSPVLVLVLGEAHLRAILAEYQQHYNTARPHQGINQRVPSGEDPPPRVTAGDFRTQQILRKPILSGLINEYARAA